MIVAHTHMTMDRSQLLYTMLGQTSIKIHLRYFESKSKMNFFEVQDVVLTESPLKEQVSNGPLFKLSSLGNNVQSEME